MRKVLLGAIAVVMIAPAAFAVPDIQLWIDGATYNETTQTWETEDGTFDLYVIAKSGVNGVKVSMALDDVDESEDVSGLGATVNGTAYDWDTYGYAPLSNDPIAWDGGSEDLPTHGVYPAWYNEFNAGNFGNAGKIADIQPPSTWDPLDGYLPGAGGTRGEFKKFTIVLNGDFAVHFDAYTLNADGTIAKFAPFSHDAGRTYRRTPPPPGVPEPATMLLFGLGAAGYGVVRRFKK